MVSICRGAQITAFTAVFSGMYLYLQDWREKRDMLNVAASGAATGASLTPPVFLFLFPQRHLFC